MHATMAAARAGAIGVLLLAGCTGGASTGGNDSLRATGPSARSSPDGGRPASARPPYRRYVALGDSFTAAPLVPTTELAGGCFRSDGNYPSLVARRLGIPRLVDVSCSGADTADLSRPQPTYRDVTVPPQLDAVSTATDVVTVGIGGNDFGLFGTLLSTCPGLRRSDFQGAPCRDRLRAEGRNVLRESGRVGGRVARALREVSARAPRARVLLVGYPRIVPAHRTCPRLLPLARGDYAFVDRVAASLNRAMRRAAGAAGAEFVDMRAASRGHDVCARRPWVNGRFTARAAALAFHPLAAGMDAVADRIVARLRRPHAG